jgi:hypothetical protein
MLEKATKPCFKCGEIKPLSLFYRHPAMADGHGNKCKECNKLDVILNRKDKVEYYNEYDRIRGRIKESKRNKATRERAKLPNVKLLKAILLKERSLKYPERYKANYTIANGIRDSRITRPCNCEFCGKECKPQAHHSSYSEDMWLLVTWLCTSCHGEVHRLYD